ncbi:hypothetical protein R8Z50_01350 [Longispora sp. K20-0274]|uniref:hypothetical protein n=1 Tax=Longispora sp. K20-0274 TaxID=3088255 RepID=UPI00399B5E32
MSTSSTNDSAVRFAAAVREAVPDLALDVDSRTRLYGLIVDLEFQLKFEPDGASGISSAVKPIRYLLVEVAQGPVAAVLADSASRLVGDDTGRLFW